MCCSRRGAADVWESPCIISRELLFCCRRGKSQKDAFGKHILNTPYFVSDLWCNPAMCFLHQRLFAADYSVKWRLDNLRVHMEKGRITGNTTQIQVLVIASQDLWSYIKWIFFFTVAHFMRGINHDNGTSRVLESNRTSSIMIYFLKITDGDENLTCF